MDSYYTFRWRRWRRRCLNRISLISGFIGQLFTRHVLKRSARLRYVQRFLAGWLVVFVLALVALSWQSSKLDSYYLIDQPTTGGSYVEGVVGKFSSLNPLFADTLPARTANRLIFSGLVKHGANGRVEPDLASEWSINDELTQYTFKLRPGLSWHDGTPLTSKDVAFTIKSAQDPAVNSPLRRSWLGVNVETPDTQTVRFSLETPFAPFTHLLTLGILPEHILGEVAPSELRVSQFNQSPIGAGPYQIASYLPGQGELHLKSFNGYGLGRPKITRFVIKSFDNHNQLVEALDKRSISGAGGFESETARKATQLNDTRQLFVPTSSQTFLFMNMKRKSLHSAQLRRAVTQSISAQGFAKHYGETLRVANSPLLPEHLGYRKDLEQLETSLKGAEDRLKDVGRQSRSKLKLLSPDADFYPQLAASLKEQLLLSGIELELVFEDLGVIQSQHLPARDYDLLLYTVSLGADPDSYAYWHSSQASSDGLNLSNYKSSTVDEALAAGRTREDKRTRSAKYYTFQRQWREDAPAVALLRHLYPYAYRGIQNLDIDWVVDPLDRFSDVHNWAVRYEPVLKRRAE